MKYRPSLRTILLWVNLIVFLMPLAGIALMRIYDSQLIRRTESELLSQAAFVQALYRDALRREFERSGTAPGSYGTETDVQWPDVTEDGFKPVAAEIDAASAAVRPPAEPAAEPIEPPAPEAIAAGEAIMPTMEEAKEMTLAGIRVVDPNGIVVASTGSELGQSLAHREEVRRALDGEFVRLLRERGGGAKPPLESISRRTGVRVFVAVPIAEDGRLVGAVILSRTPMSLFKAIYRNRWLFASLLLSLFIGVLAISLMTSVSINRPIRALIDQTRAIADDGSGGEPIESPGTAEFAELSEAFASMARSLREREDYIRTFARNVSHEFKTPLSSMRGTVELLADHLDEMSEEERSKFLGILEADVERLDHLVGRLLELARADVARPGSGPTDVNGCLETSAERHRTDGFDVRFGASPAEATVAMDEETFDSVMGNLLENARQYGASQARIEAEMSGDDVVITVVDDGPGISPGNAERIFENFFTTARDKGGTGLGLPIVRTLVEAHEGEIRLVLSDGGAHFEIRLPAAGEAEHGGDAGAS